jgi:hypothetical protein
LIAALWLLEALVCCDKLPLFRVDGSYIGSFGLSSPRKKSFKTLKMPYSSFFLFFDV